LEQALYLSVHYDPEISKAGEVDTEVMKYVNRTEKEIKVERHALGSSAATHDKDAVVKLRTTLTGVSRGQAGSRDVDHAIIKVSVPRGFLVMPRHDGKAHISDTKINYFYSDDQRKAAMRMTFAHECAHSCNFVDRVKDPTIMIFSFAPGAIDGNGIYHDLDDFNFINNRSVANRRKE
jgi:hypothetical protein